MEKWYSKFRRGDVWYLHFNDERGDGLKGSSVQKKSRPYLIVSCEENNLNAPTFNVVPITTRDSDHLPMHVYFRYQEGAEARNQLVLCEQITTVSALTFNDPKSYFMYSFKLEFMNKVDEALTRQLGLKPRIADMHILERIIHELAESEMAKVEAAKKKEANMRVENLAEYLAKVFRLDITTQSLQEGLQYRPEELQHAEQATIKQMQNTAKERSVSPTIVPPKPDTTNAEVPTGKVVTKRRRARWTEEDKKQFLLDYKSLSIAQMSEKYGIKKSSVAYNACTFRKDLGTDAP